MTSMTSSTGAHWWGALWGCQQVWSRAVWAQATHSAEQRHAYVVSQAGSAPHPYPLHFPAPAALRPSCSSHNHWHTQQAPPGAPTHPRPPIPCLWYPVGTTTPTAAPKAATNARPPDGAHALQRHAAPMHQCASATYAPLAPMHQRTLTSRCACSPAPAAPRPSSSAAPAPAAARLCACAAGTPPPPRPPRR